MKPKRKTADQLIAERRKRDRGAVSTAYPPADTPDSAIDWPRIWGQLKQLHAQVRALQLENERLRRLLSSRPVSVDRQPSTGRTPCP